MKVIHQAVTSANISGLPSAFAFVSKASNDPTRLREPFCEVMPMGCDPGPCLRKQRAIMDEIAKPIHKAAGVCVVEASKDELRDMHIGSWSASSILSVLLRKPGGLSDSIQLKGRPAG